jgi:hypothetical protein
MLESFIAIAVEIGDKGKLFFIADHLQFLDLSYRPGHNIIHVGEFSSANRATNPNRYFEA